MSKPHMTFAGMEGNRSLQAKGKMPRRRVRLNYDQRTFRKDCINRPDLVAEYNRKLQEVA